MVESTSRHSFVTLGVCMGGILSTEVIVLGWGLKSRPSPSTSFQHNPEKRSMWPCVGSSFCTQAVTVRGRGGEAGTEPTASFFQALPYVALLIAMLFFIYAVIGMQVSTGHFPPVSPLQASPRSVARCTLARGNGKPGS